MSLSLYSSSSASRVRGCEVYCVVPTCFCVLFSRVFIFRALGGTHKYTMGDTDPNAHAEVDAHVGPITTPWHATPKHEKPSHDAPCLGRVILNNAMVLPLEVSWSVAVLLSQYAPAPRILVVDVTPSMASPRLTGCTKCALAQFTKKAHARCRLLNWRSSAVFFDRQRDLKGCS